MAELATRTAASRRAENAYRKTACKQRTTAERLVYAKVLLDVMERHGVTIGRLSMLVDMNEKTVWKMLHAEVSIPVHLPGRLPTDMRWELIDGLARACGCDPAGGAKRVLDRIRREKDIEAAHELEDRARELARELGRR